MEAESVSVFAPTLATPIVPEIALAYARSAAVVSKPNKAPEAKLPVPIIAPTSESDTLFGTASVAPPATL